MSLKWDEPTMLTNAIIDINPINIDYILEENVWGQLSELGCEHVQIRSFDYVDLNILEEKINL